MGGGVRGEQTLQLAGQSNTGKTQVWPLRMLWQTSDGPGDAVPKLDQWACLGADMFDCSS